MDINLDKNINLNNSLLKEIENNRKINKELLKDIQENENINKNIKKEIEINKSIQNELNNYINKLSKFKKEALKYLTVNNSQKLQNCGIGTTSNCIVKIENNGKINQNIVFTKGMIISWFGQSNEIPEEWAICDGTNGTPDLRNKFIIGVSDEIKFNSVGGNSTIKISKTNLPPIGISYFSSESHRGSYHHSTNGFLKYQGSYSTYIKGSEYDDDWGSNWKIDLNEGMNSTPINIINPYLALFYIMKL